MVQGPACIKAVIFLPVITVPFLQKEQRDWVGREKMQDSVRSCLPCLKFLPNSLDVCHEEERQQHAEGF